MSVTSFIRAPFWQSWGVMIARLIVAGVFLMAAAFKFMDIGITANAITAVGIPFAVPLSWVAAFFELALAFAFLTGAYFREAALLSIVYILFLGITFHGPSMWAANQMEFGFFVDHFVFVAGLLYMLAHGPGNWRLGKES